MLEMLKELAILSPVIAVLIVGIIYLYRQNTSKEKEITGLNKEIRDSEKSTLDLLNRLTGTLEHLSKEGDGQTEDIKNLSNQIREFKDKIEQRLMEIQIKMNNKDV